MMLVASSMSPLAETVEAMEALKRAGKIRHWGVSNLDVDDMEELVEAGGTGCVTDQILYNLTRRGPDYELLPWLATRGMSAMAQASSNAGLISAIAPAIGTLVGGFVVDRLSRRSIGWLATLPAVCCLIATPLYIAAGLVPSVGSMILLVGLAGFLMGMLVPAGYAALHAVTGPTDRALGVAVAFFILNLIGYGAGPAAIGLISDATSARFGPASIAVALGLSLLLLLPAALAFGIAAKRMRIA